MRACWIKIVHGKVHPVPNVRLNMHYYRILSYTDLLKSNNLIVLYYFGYLGVYPDQYCSACLCALQKRERLRLE